MQKELINIKMKSNCIVPILYIAWGYLMIFLLIKLIFQFYTSVYILIIIFFLISRYQRYIGILIHEGVHENISNSRFLNNTLTQLILAAPLGINFYRYKFYHLLHHKNLLSKSDPDLNYFGCLTKNPVILFKVFIWDIFGFEYLKELYEEAKYNINRKWSFTFLLNQLFFLLSTLALNYLIFKLFFLGNLDYFFIFWILPRISWGKFTHRVRTWVEHTGLNENSDQIFMSRSVYTGIIKWLISPLNASLHIEHHLFPQVPFYKLKKISNYLEETNAEFKVCKNRYISYFDFFKEFYSTNKIQL